MAAIIAAVELLAVDKGALIVAVAGSIRFGVLLAIALLQNLEVKQ